MKFFPVVFLFCLLMGCLGDKLRLVDKVNASMINGRICLHVANADSYSVISMYTLKRGIESDRNDIDIRTLTAVENTCICLPPEAGLLSEDHVSLIRTSMSDNSSPEKCRYYVAALGMINGQLKNFPLLPREMAYFIG